MTTLWKAAVAWCSVVIPIYYAMPLIESGMHRMVGQLVGGMLGQ